MLRKFLLPALAAATLAGCATDYSYRGGSGGDYYYGQPRTEYRYYGSYGYGDYGYGGYYYDRYGRLIYASPYGYYGYPFGYGGGWYRPRPPHGGHQPGTDGDHAGERPDRKPPWRDIGGMVPRTVDEDGEDARRRPRRQAVPFTMPAPPQRESRMTAPEMPRMGGGDMGGSRMGRAIRNAKAADE